LHNAPKHINGISRFQKVAVRLELRNVEVASEIKLKRRCKLMLEQDFWKMQDNCNGKNNGGRNPHVQCNPMPKSSIEQSTQETGNYTEEQ
jgi:hypothetical protein